MDLFHSNFNILSSCMAQDGEESIRLWVEQTV